MYALTKKIDSVQYRIIKKTLTDCSLHIFLFISY